MAFESNIVCTKCVHVKGANKFKKFNYTRDYVVSTVVLSITVHYFEKHLICGSLDFRYVLFTKSI